MGLLLAGVAAASSVLADQWREYFTCDALPADVLVARARKRNNGASSNHGNDNVISNGSIIAVADGQCMIIVEQGKVVDLCAEPGEYVYDMSSEPSLFYGNLGENIKGVFASIGKRFTFGGSAPQDQRVYYFNTKEIMNNKFGTPGSVPFRVVDRNIGLDMDVSVRCFGMYSYRITNPILFYTNICGNVADVYKRDNLDAQLKSEFLAELQPAFARLSEMGVRYSALPGHTKEFATAINEQLSSEWRDRRGIEVISISISSVKADEEDEKMIKELQRNAAFRDPSMAAAQLVGAQSAAMQSAASNPNGAAMAFMGMGMAQQAGGMNAQALYGMAQQQQMQQAQMQQAQMQQQAAPAADAWTCPTCNASVSGKFCPECGTKKPEPQMIQPQAGWTCSCGAVNQGKFCQNCGSKKPAGAPLYRCDKCGWTPADPTHPPKFCPECGDTFDENDIQQ